MPESLRIRVLFLLLVLGAACGSLPAANAEEPDCPNLAAIAAVDTTPSNIWVARAMISDILAEVETRLPTRPSRIVLRPKAEHEAGPLFQEMAARRLETLGHDLYLDETDIAREGEKAATVAGDVDLVLTSSIESLTLAYPQSGRRFGLWRQWVDRELEMVTFLTLVEAQSGRLLMDRRLVRRYADRVPSDRFESLASPAYNFTQAAVAPTGFRGILENLVVVGSLAGMVAVYFANSGS